VVDAGDVVVYPVPSWNNNYYVYMSGTKGAVIPTSPEQGFMPTVEQIRPTSPQARLLCLGSPLNPTGTMFAAEQLKALCEAVVARTSSASTRPVRRSSSCTTRSTGC
jgi:aspartate aminotransferase